MFVEYQVVYGSYNSSAQVYDDTPLIYEIQYWYISLFMCRITILISLYAFVSKFGILILNWNMLLNRCNITISLCFPTSLLIISVICEFTLGECLVYCSLHITSFYSYTCLLSIKLSRVAITVLHRCMVIMLGIVILHHSPT